jgi:hypothetical protein
MAGPVQTSGTSFTYGKPVKVFDTKYAEPATAFRSYDVSGDGKRFLMIKEVDEDKTSAPRGMIIVENWFEELKSRVAAR